MIEQILHSQPELLCLLAGLVVGLVLGIAIGHPSGKADGIRETTAGFVAASAGMADPYDAIRNEIRKIEAGGAGPFDPSRGQ
jgi:hypothetical protein